MTIKEKLNSNKGLKKSDWEMDFYSRPIIEKNGKKRWELIISSSKNFKTEDIFLWNKICPANEVNSIWLTKALNEALNDAGRKGWTKPSKIRFWRASMKSIIKKSIENIGIEPLISRRTYELFDRIEFLEKEVYPLEDGYVRGCLLYTSPSPRDS